MMHFVVFWQLGILLRPMSNDVLHFSLQISWVYSNYIFPLDTQYSNHEKQSFKSLFRGWPEEGNLLSHWSSQMSIDSRATFSDYKLLMVIDKRCAWWYIYYSEGYIIIWKKHTLCWGSNSGYETQDNKNVMVLTEHGSSNWLWRHKKHKEIKGVDTTK